MELLSLNCVELVASFTEVKIEAVVTLVSNILQRHLPTPIALDYFFNSLSRLNNHFDSMLIRLVTPNFQGLEWGCEVAVLAKTEVRAVGTHKAGTYNWLHIASYAFVLVMGC